MPSASFFKDSTPAPLELEQMFGKEIILFLYFSNSLPILDQLCTDILVLGYLFNLVLFGNHLVLDGFSIEELCLDGIATPGVETDGHASAFEGGHLFPSLCGD